MVTKGLIARLEAKAGKEDEVAAFLRDALPIVQGESDVSKPPFVTTLTPVAGTVPDTTLTSST